MTKLNVKLFFFIFVISFVLFNFYFIFEFQTPNYVYCNEITEYSIEIFEQEYSFNYPKSCDQDLYHIGFKDFSQILAPDFNYAERPVYIVFIGSIYNILLMFAWVDSYNYLLLLLATFIGQILIVQINTNLFINLFDDQINRPSQKYLIALIFLLSPLVKWGIFDPSHQLLTLTAILSGLYFKKLNYQINYKNSILFGFLMLLHRTFFIVFIWLALVELLNSFRYKKITIFIKDILISLIPTGALTVTKYTITGVSYDANTEYWGQFVWLLDFVRGKTRFESEWHCVSIPENFICYFQDNIKLIVYMGLIFIYVLFFSYKNINKIRNDKNITNLVSLSMFLFIFWSFIGWYPPIRFSYYSIGNLAVLLFLIFILNIKNKKFLFFSILSYVLYTVYLNHWNYQEIVNYNYPIIASYVILCIFIILENNTKKSIFYS
jgi:hypothetical protein